MVSSSFVVLRLSYFRGSMFLIIVQGVKIQQLFWYKQWKRPFSAYGGKSYMDRRQNKCTTEQLTTALLSLTLPLIFHPWIVLGGFGWSLLPPPRWKNLFFPPTKMDKYRQGEVTLENTISDSLRAPPNWGSYTKTHIYKNQRKSCNSWAAWENVVRPCS